MDQNALKKKFRGNPPESTKPAKAAKVEKPAKAAKVEKPVPAPIEPPPVDNTDADPNT